MGRELQETRTLQGHWEYNSVVREEGNPPLKSPNYVGAHLPPLFPKELPVNQRNLPQGNQSPAGTGTSSAQSSSGATGIYTHIPSTHLHRTHLTKRDSQVINQMHTVYISQNTTEENMIFRKCIHIWVVFIYSSLGKVLACLTSTSTCIQSLKP